jgi:orotidine-5'-phosphate decarboxylase
MPDAGTPPASGPATGPVPFGERLAAAVAARESQIVLGIDPDPARLWPAAQERIAEARAAVAAALGVEALDPSVEAAVGADAPTAVAFEAAVAVLAHCRALIDAAGPACVAAKPQLACFERLGVPGRLVLGLTCEYARAAGLIVLADAKRGDVPVTARAYAQSLTGAMPTPFGPVPGLRADAITANPLLGRDALEPLIDDARASGAGVFVLVRTSNLGAADVLDLELAGGERLWERLAMLVAALGGTGEGLADVGAVTGATAPEHLARMRELMPRTPFLLPGVGAQGGDVATLAPAFAPGRAAGLVTASRSIADAGESSGDDAATAARREAERLRETAWSLA